jgi:hypothetical protein
VPQSVASRRSHQLESEAWPRSVAEVRSEALWIAQDDR